MPTIGYCHDCGEWVYVRPDWSCPSEHPAVRVNGWYDSATGDAVAPPAPPAVSVVRLSEPIVPVDAGASAGTRAAFLADVLSTLTQSKAYCAGVGLDTDVIVASNPVDPSWGTGDRRAEYNGALKAVESDRTVYFWEQMRLRGGGESLDALEPGAAPTTDDEDAAKRDGAVGPGSASWEMGYGTLRTVVEEVAARHGFQVRVVLGRPAAAW